MSQAHSLSHEQEQEQKYAQKPFPHINSIIVFCAAEPGEEIYFELLRKIKNAINHAPFLSSENKLDLSNQIETQARKFDGNVLDRCKMLRSFLREQIKSVSFVVNLERVDKYLEQQSIYPSDWQRITCTLEALSETIKVFINRAVMFSSTKETFLNHINTEKQVLERTAGSEVNKCKMMRARLEEQHILSLPDIIASPLLVEVDVHLKEHGILREHWRGLACSFSRFVEKINDDINALLLPPECKQEVLKLLSFHAQNLHEDKKLSELDKCKVLRALAERIKRIQSVLVYPQGDAYLNQQGILPQDWNSLNQALLSASKYSLFALSSDDAEWKNEVSKSIKMLLAMSLA